MLQWQSLEVIIRTCMDHKAENICYLGLSEKKKKKLADSCFKAEILVWEIQVRSCSVQLPNKFWNLYYFIILGEVVP